MLENVGIPSQWAVCFNDWTKVWLPFIAPLRPLAKWAQQFLGSEPLDVSCCCNLEWCFPNMLILYQAHMMHLHYLHLLLATWVPWWAIFLVLSVSQWAFRTKERMALHPFTLEATWTAHDNECVSRTRIKQESKRLYSVDTGHGDKDYSFFLSRTSFGSQKAKIAHLFRTN